MRDDVSLSYEQAHSGQYGDIIPIDAKKIPPGGNVYQFDKPYHRNSKGEYIGT